jgi:hypothetical protein
MNLIPGVSKAKSAAARKGIKQSEETKQHMREATKLRLRDKNGSFISQSNAKQL